MVQTQHDNLTTIIEQWPTAALYPHETEAIYDVLVALASSLDTYDDDVQAVLNQHFLDTATGRELDKLAAEVGVQRQTGESDERLRFRAIIQKVSTRSRGTFEDIAQTMVALFGAEDANTIELVATSTGPILEVRMPRSLLNDTPLTRAEFEDALSDVVPAGDSVEVLTDDLLILGESGDQGLGGKLT